MKRQFCWLPASPNCLLWGENPPYSYYSFYMYVNICRLSWAWVLLKCGCFCWYELQSRSLMVGAGWCLYGCDEFGVGLPILSLFQIPTHELWMSIETLRVVVGRFRAKVLLGLWKLSWRMHYTSKMLLVFHFSDFEKHCLCVGFNLGLFFSEKHIFFLIFDMPSRWNHVCKMLGRPWHLTFRPHAGEARAGEGSRVLYSMGWGFRSP